MATESLVSAALTAAAAGTFTKANTIRGQLRGATATITTTAKDTGSTYRMIRVPSSAIIQSVRIASADLGTGGTLDVGIYQTPENGGAVVDADHFASAVDCKTAAVALTEIIQESGVVTLAKLAQPLWQALGLSADTNREYDIVMTSVEAIATGGDVALQVQWLA